MGTLQGMFPYMVKPSTVNNTLGKLTKLKRIRFVGYYQHRFQFLLARTHDLKLKQHEYLFSVWTIDELRIDVELQQ